MAITTVSSPTNHEPAFADRWSVVSSNNYTQTNFKYVFDLYVSGVTSPSYYRYTIDPNPSDTYGYFNLAAALRDHLGSDIKTVYINNLGQQTVRSTNGETYIGYSLNIGEQYGASSGVTVYPDLATITSKYFWNGSFNWREMLNTNWQGYSYKTYKAGNSGELPFNALTTMPTSGLTVRTDERGWMLYSSDTPNGVTSVVIKQYDSSGALQTTNTITIPATYTYPATNSGNRFVWFPSRPQSLVDAGFVWSAYTTSYTLQLISASYDDSVVYRFYVNDECGRGDLTTFVWRNRLGGMETFSFIKSKKESISVEKKDYKHFVLPTVSNAIYGETANLVSDRFKSDYYTTITDSYTVTSDYLTETHNDYIEDLISSPEVYIASTVGALGTEDVYLLPIKITTNELVKKKHKYNGLVRYELSYVFTDSRLRPRG